MAKRILIGNDDRGKSVYLTPEDRAEHMQVVGSTGVGKSKFLEWMIREDIFNRNGVCLIDPHGSLYENILIWLASMNITDREVILLDVTNWDWTTLFNPFAMVPGSRSIAAQVNRKIKAVLRVWGAENSDQTPSLERWLRCFWHVIISQNLSYLETEYFIHYGHQQIREYLSRPISTELIKSDLEDLASFKRNEFYKEILSTRNRLSRILHIEQLRRTMGMTMNNLDLMKCMDERAILLVNLQAAGDFDSEASNLLGALLINQLYETALQRKKDSFGRSFPEPFYLYVDEIERFVTPDIGRILEECRKMGLHAIFAHQHLGQLERDNTSKDILGSFIGCARNKAVFGGLPPPDNDYLVRTIFRLNPLQIKHIQHAIAFWPVYTREQVKSHSEGTVEGSGGTSGKVLSTGSNFSYDGLTLAPLASALQNSHSLQSGDSWNTSKSVQDGVSDVPFLMPKPYQQETDRQFWRFEELDRMFSQALQFQFARNYILKMRDNRVIPMTVPEVDEHRIFAKIFEEYQLDIRNRSPYCLPSDQVEKAIEDRRSRLLLETKENQVITAASEKGRPEREKSRTKVHAPPKTQRIKPNPSKT